ncbi:MAG TPA: acyl-CoA dehydrogenase family protein [Myxococcota bacterium]|nr:acyl-CoA dehydrogenase family protein [Myxococcota bacterium]
MDFRFSQAELEYRDQARAWIRAHIPSWWENHEGDEFESEDATFDGIRRWHQELYDAGYVGVTWPKEYGGQGRTHVENALLQEELVLAGAPPATNGLGIGLCGPAIVHHGTEAQKRRFLRPMLRAEEMWCQGYSEPGAGSDLANLRTTAELRGDRYVVNGQKIWTSQAHRADWIFCLVRTDPKADKHEGIGFLLIDMKTPGIEVAPLVQMTGNRGFSQCFFKDVVVPAENLIGKPTQGWQIANTVLGYERGASTLSRYAGYRREFDQVVETARQVRRGGRPATQDRVTRQRVAQAFVELEVLRLNSLRSLTALANGHKPGSESSLQKLYYSEMGQRLARLGNDLLGPYGQLLGDTPRAPERGRAAQRELQSRAPTIFAGTSEIQRNIIAERVLGLPRR